MVRRYGSEKIVSKLREADILIDQGQSLAQAIETVGVSEETYGSWRQECIGVNISLAERIKELEEENAQLRKAVSAFTKERLIIKEASKGFF